MREEKLEPRGSALQGAALHFRGFIHVPTCPENQAEAARWPRGVTLPAVSIGTSSIRRFTTHRPEQADQRLTAILRRAAVFAAGRRALRPLMRRRRGSGV